MKKTIYLALVVALTITLLHTTSQDKNLTVNAQQVVVATSTPKFEDTLSYPQKAWLGALEYCESRGHPDITELDTNNQYSYGILQFQMNTFLPYGIKYGFLPATTTIDEALKVIHDPVLQEEIATSMIADGMASRWKICTKKLGDPYPLSPQKDLQE